MDGKNLKEQKEKVQKAKKQKINYLFSECENEYNEFYAEKEAVFESMIKIKVGLQKYMRKLKHIANEIE